MTLPRDTSFPMCYVTRHTLLCLVVQRWNDSQKYSTCPWIEFRHNSKAYVKYATTTVYVQDCERVDSFTHSEPHYNTYSMVQSPSWEGNWFVASQEIPLILCNPEVHYRTHKRPPPVPVLCQPNPAHIPTSHLLEIHPNIIHPSTPN